MVPRGSGVWCCGARVRQAQVSGGGRGGGRGGLSLPTWPLARLSRPGRRRAGHIEAGVRASGPGCGLLSQALFRQHLGDPATSEFCDLGQTVRVNLDFFLWETEITTARLAGLLAECSELLCRTPYHTFTCVLITWGSGDLRM